jgi:Pentapeptide repeats (8 copies)/Divergent InlB B-repeat domain
VSYGGSGTSVTATPAAGYTFTSWSDGNTNATRTDSNVTANLSVSASFTLNSYTLTYTANAGGTIRGTTPQTVNSGASGSPVTATPNVGFTFSSWSDGNTSATRTDSNVTASAAYTASFAKKPLGSGTSTTVTATAKASVTATVGSFTDPNTAAAAAAFTASINWGDSSQPSNGTVSGSNGSFSVSGTHTYQLDGSYPISVSVTGDGSSVNLTATASVGEQANGISVTGAALTGSSYVEGSALSNVSVASFTDAGAGTPASGYSATIDWGDGSQKSTGAVAGSNGTFTVAGGHTYAEEGKYTTTIAVTKTGVTGGTGNATGSITVSDADKFTGTAAAPIGATAGTALSNVSLATFTDAYTGHTDASDFAATINWGDSSQPSTGTVSGSGGSFTVRGSHTYATKGAYSVSVTLSDNEPPSNPSQPVATATVTVAATVLQTGGTGCTAGSGIDLSYCNLSGQSLQGANLKGGNLTGANLVGVSLQGANLQGANAENADLAGVNLQGANLQTADLKGANLSNANLSGDNLQNAELQNANLSNANLQGANLQNANATGANLTGANLQGANTNGLIR